MTDYVTTSGVPLFRRPAMFHWRGRYFSGLVTGCGVDINGKVVSGGALYDDPKDSFAAHVGIKSSLEEGLIIALPERKRED